MRLTLGLGAATALSLASAASASLIGDEVFSTITPSSIWQSNPSSAIVTDPGPEFNLDLVGDTFFSVNLDASSITLDYVAIGGLDMGAGEMYVLSDLDWVGQDGEIIGFELTLSATGISGFDASDISFTADSITMVLNGSVWQQGDTFATIELIVSHTCGAFPCGNNDRKVLLCHVPPGNPANAHTLCISPNAVPAHLGNHGSDHCGPCGSHYGFVYDLVQLDGTATDSDGDPVESWSWTIDSAPVGSTATLSDATIQNPTLTPDVAGRYFLSLVVSDGTDDSLAASVTITAVPPCPWDLDNSGDVDVPDLLRLLATWGNIPTPDPPDFDGDGVVAVPDLLALLANWGLCP